MKSILLLAVLIVIAIANISSAQTDTDKTADKKQFRVQLDSIMKQKLMEKLNLSESSADKYISAFRENNDKVKELMKEKKSLMRSIEANPEAPDIGTKLDQSFDIDNRIIETRRSFVKDVSSYLTPQQIAKSMILKKNFNKEFKNQIKKHKNKNIHKKNKKQK